MLTLLLSLALCSTTFADQCLESAMYESNSLYSTGGGYEDGIFTAVSSSMIGWGIGLAAAIALVAGLVHQSAGANTHSANDPQ